MADNVLATLFQDQADAIREGLGDIGKIAPLDFPARTREMAALIGAGGSGGGSLPAGVYLEHINVKAPNKYYQWWFELNGDLYCIHIPYAGNGTAKAALKYVDGAWIEVVASTSLSTSVKPEFVHNGKLHICGEENVVHWTFDGSAFTRMSDIPNKIASNGMAAFNGTIYAYSCYDGGLYVWDEATDTWTLEATIGGKYAYYYPFVLNDELWFVKNEKVYKYSAGVLEEKATLDYAANNFFVKQECFYYINNNTFKLFKYDPITNMNSVAGDFPKNYLAGYPCHFWTFGDNVRVTMNETSDAGNEILNFNVHIVE